MSAIQALIEAVKRIEEAQNDCMEFGSVKDSHRYRFQLLERERIHLKSSLDWMISCETFKAKKQVKKEDKFKKKGWLKW